MKNEADLVIQVPQKGLGCSVSSVIMMHTHFTLWNIETMRENTNRKPRHIFINYLVFLPCANQKAI